MDEWCLEYLVIGYECGELQWELDDGGVEELVGGFFVVIGVYECDCL